MTYELANSFNLSFGSIYLIGFILCLIFGCIYNEIENSDSDLPMGSFIPILNVILGLILTVIVVGKLSYKLYIKMSNPKVETQTSNNFVLWIILSLPIVSLGCVFLLT